MAAISDTFATVDEYGQKRESLSTLQYTYNANDYNILLSDFSPPCPLLLYSHN